MLQPENRFASAGTTPEIFRLVNVDNLKKLGLPPQHYESALRSFLALELPYQASLLILLERLQPLDQQSLLILMEGLEPLHQESLLILMEGLEPLHQESLLILMEGLEPLHQHSLLRLLEELQPPYQQSLLILMEGLEPLDQQSLLRLLEGLEPLHQEQLLHCLELREVEYQQVCLSVIEQLEQVHRFLLPMVEKPIESLLRPSGRQNLVRALRELEPLEQEKLLKELTGSESIEQVKIVLRVLGGLSDPLEQEKLKTVEPPRMPNIMGEVLAQIEELLEEVAERLVRQERLLEEYKHLLQQFVEWLMVYLSVYGGLLLDAWWLEFWELVLLAAGDVERNPGPRRMTDEQLAKIDNRPLRKDGDLHKVFDAVYDCRAKWYNLCLALQVFDDDLSAIKREHRDIATCLLRGISLWLQGVYSYGPPTWRVLVDAIANSSGGDNHVLALELSDKHQTITTAASSHHTRADHKKSEEMSSAFSRMYRFIVQHLQVDVHEVQASLHFLTVPHHPDQLCVPPSVYEDVTTTKELLTKLCPCYVNPRKTFVLEEIVSVCDPQTECERRLRNYIDKYMQ